MVYTVGNMNGGKNRGYTIVEVMIFLAISGVMFVMAAIFISGKQAAASFTQGVNDTASQLEAAAQEASNGQFPELDSLSCTVGAGSLSFGVAGQGQGTNGPCVFLGNVVHFSPGNDATAYDILPVAGERNTSTDTVITIDQSKPTIIDSLISSKVLPQALQVSGMKANGLPNKFAFGFMTSPATDISGSKLANGAQSVSLYYIDGIGNSNSDSDVKGNMLSPGNIKPAQEVDICFYEATNRNAAIVIGARNNTLSVSVDRTGAITC